MLEERCYDCALLLQVHDELVFALPEELVQTVEPEIVTRMENAYKLDVRLRVDSKSGPNWADMSSCRASI
jgi:DNA polymerase-1